MSEENNESILDSFLVSELDAESLVDGIEDASSMTRELTSVINDVLSVEVSPPSVERGNVYYRLSKDGRKFEISIEEKTDESSGRSFTRITYTDTDERQFINVKQEQNLVDRFRQFLEDLKNTGKFL